MTNKLIQPAWRVYEDQKKKVRRMAKRSSSKEKTVSESDIIRKLINEAK